LLDPDEVVGDASSVTARLTRTWWPAVAVVSAVAAFLTDWPLGWRFWVDHPLAAALVAGALIILLTVAVVDAYLRSRESRRWHSVGRVAAAEFSHIFDQATLGMVGLLGFDPTRPRPEIESALAGPRGIAQRLLGEPVGLDPEELLLRQRDPTDPVDDRWQRDRLTVVMRDPAWIKGCHETLVAIARLQLEIISRWVSSFALLNDEEHLARVERALRLIEAERALDSRLLLSSDQPELAEGVPQQWSSLVADYRTEANYWYLLYQASAEVPDLGPRRAEAERDQAVTAAAMTTSPP
jgi:hypothetical protein